SKAKKKAIELSSTALFLFIDHKAEPACMKKYLLHLFLAFVVFAPQSGNAQSKFWLELTDKGDLSHYQPTDLLSPQALANRAKQGIPLDFTDYPVNPNYIQALKALGIQPLRVSKWFNMVSAELTYEQQLAVYQIPFIKDIRPVQGVSRIADYLDDRCPEVQLTDTPERQLDMVQVNALHRAGYTGKGVTIAVFDNGYRGVDTLSAFNHLYVEGRILATKDYVDNDDDVYGACIHCRHGTNVFSILAANQPGVLTGSAPEANYILLRTENDSSETHQEEDNWLAAAEFADSLGAQVFTTSLGYFNFDPGEGSYTKADLDGNTAIITRAADMAGEKGILVVNSAGNSASRGVTAPADGDFVIAVGAVDQCASSAGFTSQGPLVDGRIKPDVMAMGRDTYLLLPDGALSRGSGTSFSCPVISGMLACVVQAAPMATRAEIYDALIQSADKYLIPDRYYGYGIPNARTMLEMLGQDLLEANTYEDPFASSDLIIYPNPNGGNFMLSLPIGVEGFDAQLEIFDIRGSKVHTQLLELGSVSLPYYLEVALQAGIYEVRIQDTANENRRYLQKLIVY
ncbi:MAG: S8 family serine peptidase, partial [Bacteroidota bacterium]